MTDDPDLALACEVIRDVSGESYTKAPDCETLQLARAVERLVAERDRLRTHAEDILAGKAARGAEARSYQAELEAARTFMGELECPNRATHHPNPCPECDGSDAIRLLSFSNVRRPQAIPRSAVTLAVVPRPPL